MFEKPYEDVTKADLDTLIAQGRSEGRRLDFKAQLPGGGDSDVKEFLADITSFANTDGGDLLIGVTDTNGIATGLSGFSDEVLDQEILRIESRVRAGVDPRLQTFRVHPIPLGDGQVALLLRVPASLTAPHRVCYKGNSRFFARNSRGKFEMDTGELRRAFAATDDLPRRLRDLHTQAVEATSGKDMPFSIDPEPTVVLTVAPLSILREARDIPMTRENAVLPPRVTGGGIHMRVALDGIIVHSPFNDGARGVRCWSYNHRRGYVDCAWTIGRKLEDAQRVIWRKYFEEELPGAARSIVSRLRTYELEGPWVAMASMRNTMGYRVILGNEYLSDAAWLDSAHLGEIVDEALEPESLQPFTDAFLRLFGVDHTSGVYP